MPPRIVLFGATGFTGRLVAAALVRRGVALSDLLLAGRDAGRLAQVAAEMPGQSRPAQGRPDTAVVDARDEAGPAGLLRRGDVLVTTVGPFARVGGPAVRAAVTAGAAYLDCTGEPAFLRRVFEHDGPAAEAAGVALLPAFGYDYVPGNLAAGLALQGAGGRARRVEIGYFVTGGPFAASGGTRASGAGMVLAPGFAWRGGRLVEERLAARLRHFEVAGRRRPAVSIGGSEHLALPRLTELAPQLAEVGVYVGWAGRLSRAAQLSSAVLSAGATLPGVRRRLTAAGERLLPGSTGGPDEAGRAGARSLAVAEAYDERGSQCARVVVEGPNGYDLTGELLAWGALVARAGGVSGAGALGPVDGLGLDRLVRGCAEVGLTVTSSA